MLDHGNDRLPDIRCPVHDVSTDFFLKQARLEQHEGKSLSN